MKQTPGLLGLALLAACGDDGDPVAGVVFGEPTILVVANPSINDLNARPVPAPGSARAGIEVELDTGLGTETDLGGLAVLSPVESGPRTLAFEASGEIATTMAARQLRELAVSVTGSAQSMTEVVYDFGGTVVELTPSTSVAEIEAALAASDSIIVFRAGTYVIGDLTLSGSRVTLFGEGILDDSVIIEGNVTVRGSGNRVRGALITGALVVEGSDAGIGFSTVLGPTTVTGSDTRLLYNDLCGAVSVTGSGATVVGNGGIAPVIAACP